MGQKAARQKEISAPAWLDALPSLWLLAIGLPLSRASFDQKYLWLGLFAGLSLLGLALSRRGLEISRWFLWALGFWALAWALSRLFSNYPGLAGPRLRDQGLWLGLALLGASLPLSKRAMAWASRAALGVLILSFAYVVAQSLGLEFVGDYQGDLVRARPWASFGNPTFMAAFAVGVWPLASNLESGKRRFWDSAFLMGIALVAISGARSAMLAFVFQLIIWLSLRKSQGKAMGGNKALALFIVILGAILYMGWLRPTQRWPLWQASAKLALLNPLFGQGPGSFPGAIQATLSPELKAEFARTHQFSEHPHNWVLHLLDEGGLLLLAAFVFLIWVSGRSAWRRVLDGDEFALTLSVGLLGLLAQNLFDRNLELAAGAGLLWFGLGALAAPSGPRVVAPAGQRLWLLVLGCLGLWAATRPWSLRRAALAQSGGMPQAVAQDQVNRYQDMIRANPRDPGAWFAMGQAQASQGQFAMAAASFANAHRLRPDPRALVNEANCYLSLDQAALAEARSREALRLDSGRGTAWYTLGVALFQQRKIAEAQEALTRALEIDPQDARARQLREQILR